MAPIIPFSPSVSVSTSGALSAAAVRGSFLRSLLRLKEEKMPYIDLLFANGKKSEGAEELHAQIADNVIWRRWPKGKPRRMDAGQEFYYTIVNHEYEAGIKNHKNDRFDDRTGTFQQSLSSAARNYYSLFNDIGHQLLTGTSNSDLLPSIPNSYYGISLISASHSFVSGGNTFSGTGVTATTVETDIFTMIKRFRDMKQEGKTYKYWTPDDVKIEKIVFIIPTALEKVFESLQKGNLVAQDNAALDSIAGRSNILKNRINYYVEPRLTDANDWYGVLNADPNVKPFVKVPRSDIEVTNETWPNDSYSKQTGFEYYGASARWGFSVYEPRAICQCTNT
ncbi:MAG: hypothetical protein KDD43_07470 [Bdellovibrionales bacterium]|nr:hypothetical protein [Bdellovibrionales bacterium]